MSPKSVARVTPEELREWRKHRGWTQERAAAWLGVSARHYQKLEAGAHAVSIPMSRLVRGTGLALSSAAR